MRVRVTAENTVQLPERFRRSSGLVESGPTAHRAAGRAAAPSSARTQFEPRRTPAHVRSPRQPGKSLANAIASPAALGSRSGRRPPRPRRRPRRSDGWYSRGERLDHSHRRPFRSPKTVHRVSAVQGRHVRDSRRSALNDDPKLDCLPLEPGRSGPSPTRRAWSSTPLRRSSANRSRKGRGRAMSVIRRQPTRNVSSYPGRHALHAYPQAPPCARRGPGRDG
jgi:hypothetical protein